MKKNRGVTPRRQRKGQPHPVRLDRCSQIIDMNEIETPRSCQELAEVAERRQCQLRVSQDGGFALGAGLLLMAEPRRMPVTPAFLIKMVLIVFAGLSVWALSRALVSASRLTS